MKEAGRKWQIFIIHFVFRRHLHAKFSPPEKMDKWKEVKMLNMKYLDTKSNDITESLGLNQQIYLDVTLRPPNNRGRWILNLL